MSGAMSSNSDFSFSSFEQYAKTDYSELKTVPTLAAAVAVLSYGAAAKGVPVSFRSVLVEGVRGAVEGAAVSWVVEHTVNDKKHPKSQKYAIVEAGAGLGALVGVGTLVLSSRGLGPG